ncbi:MAG TPA: chemotaxis protein CheB [bacterium]|nr:chemotaxis protein CheB [bacterium]HDP99689.1 chemotaxis protein CheB [bacterium]
MKNLTYEAIVMGVSAGGLEALRQILKVLPADFPAPIIIVQHLHPHSDDFLARDLNHRCALMVKQADEKEEIKAGVVYLAPPNYHLLIENDMTFSLTICDPVNFTRPAIDVLFETAAEVYREKLIGVVLTGANKDGSWGAKKIKQNGGMVIVQDPKTAEVETMPAAVINTVNVDHIIPLEKIAMFLIDLLTVK